MGEELEKPGELRCYGSMCENLHCFLKLYEFSTLDRTEGSCHSSDVIPSVDRKNTRWYLQVYPGGVDDEHKGIVQCSVCCENDSDANVKARISFSIRNSDSEVIADKQNQEWIEFGSGKNYDHLEIPRRILLGKLEDDIFIFTAEIIYSRSVTTIGETTSIRSELSPLVNLADDYCNLPKQMETDAVIIVGDTEIPVHSGVLRARSKVFADMFNVDTFRMNENPIAIARFGVDSVTSMVRFMYSGTTGDMDVPLALDLLRIGDRYRLDSLVSHCTSFLTAQMDESNVVEIAHIVDHVRSSKIRAQVIEYISEKVSAADLINKFTDLQEIPDIVFDALVRVKKRRSA